MIQWYPGHMAKAKKEIEEKLKLVDIVYELLDARIPYSSRNPMIKDILRDKPSLVIITKSDLADQSITKKWEKYFLDNNQNVLVVDSIRGININKITNVSKEILKEKFLKEKAKGLKERPIRTMIIGIPNVGKSTLLNRLVNKKVANVGNKPGVTKAQQWVRLNQNLDLLDTPGVLWPKFEDQTVAINLAITGAIKDEILKIEDIGDSLLTFLKENYPVLFENRYGIDSKLDNIKIIYELCKNRGLKEEDYERGYEILLNEFRNGKIGRITLDRNFR